MSNYWKDKKVVVTGAGGFIGSHAVTMLLERGAKVTAVFSPNATDKNIHERLGNCTPEKVVKNNLLLSNVCEDIVCGNDVVFHFASIDGNALFKKENQDKILQGNTQMLLNMLEASKKNNVERFLLISSAEVYGNQRGLIREEDLDVNMQWASVDGYKWSKLFAEVAGKVYSLQSSLKITIVRPGNVYGPGDAMEMSRARVIPLFIQKAMRGENITIVGNGKKQLSFLYITDLIEVLLELTETYAVCDPVNVASEEYVTLEEVAKKIKELVGNEDAKVVVERNTEEVSQRILDTGKLKKIVGERKVVSLEEGLKKTIRYFSESHPFSKD